MGMDVIGRSPRSETGEYFRNNVWWWHPLWDYCCSVAPSLLDDELAYYGHSNDGAGLDSPGARELAAILNRELEFGRTRLYADAHTKTLKAIPDETCRMCEGTGRTARDDGSAHDCHGCKGTGSRRPTAAWSAFSEENVREFAGFLEECGGFEIC